MSFNVGINVDLWLTIELHGMCQVSLIYMKIQNKRRRMEAVGVRGSGLCVWFFLQGAWSRCWQLLALQAGASVSNLHQATYLGTERLSASVGEFWWFPLLV